MGMSKKQIIEALSDFPDEGDVVIKVGDDMFEISKVFEASLGGGDQATMVIATLPC